MQRNWASMWLMSQEQGLWLDRPALDLPALDRPANVDDATKHEVTHEDIPPAQAKRRPTTPASVKVASNGFLTVPDAAKNVVKGTKDVVEKTNGSERLEAFHQLPTKSVTRPIGNPAVVDPTLDYPQLEKPQLDKAPRKRKWPITAAKDFTPEHLTEADLPQEHSTQEDLAQEDSGPTVQPVALSTNHNSRSEPSYLVASNSSDIYLTDLTWEDAYAIDATSATLTTNSTADDTSPTSLLQRLANLRVTLRFHRADLYLGIAIFVAATALLWPAAVSPRKATLSPWDRALVALGIAEAPAPAVHFQGDPGIEVWIDPHTALYYCPGEEPYGKTADGRLSSQREAQMERFEAASRSACE